MSISQWPKQERPRERLINQGAQALTDAEILAILLRHGQQGSSALDLARHLLNHFKGLRGLLQSNLQTLCQHPGMGPVKYCQLQAALELSRRQLQEELQHTPSAHTSQQVQKFMISSLGHFQQEVFAAIFLDNQYRMIQFEKLFHGTINYANIYPREVVKRALHHNAAAIIVAHNHPSGIIEPSKADIDITRLLQQALQLVDIKLLDHIVVAHNKAISLAERGFLNFQSA